MFAVLYTAFLAAIWVFMGAPEGVIDTIACVLVHVLVAWIWVCAWRDRVRSN